MGTKAPRAAPKEKPKRVPPPPPPKKKESEDMVQWYMPTIYWMGWICPVCLHGVNPKVNMCPCGKRLRDVQLTEADLPPLREVKFKMHEKKKEK